MERKIGEQFLPLVNNVEYYALLNEYAGYRIKALHKSLEQASDFTEVARIQGQIRELQRFETLRDEVQISEYNVKKN